MRSLASKATSLSRRASRHLLPRSVSASTHRSNDLAETTVEPFETSEDALDTLAPSPASTVGVPRRYSTISIFERPSTIRLVSPPPPETSEDTVNAEIAPLPFSGFATNLHPLKERRSMAPFRSYQGTQSSVAANVLSRKSMPALANATSGSITNIYPSLASTAVEDDNVAPSLPGAFPPLPPTPKHFVFGSKFDAGVSRTEFTVAAQEVLAQMNARLPSNASKLSDEMLKGKMVEVDKLVPLNRGTGDCGWGLGASGCSTMSNRFAAAHEREFAR